MSKYAVLCEHQGLYRVVNWEMFQEFHEPPRGIDLLQTMINYDLQTLWVAPGHFTIYEGPGPGDWFFQCDEKWELKSYDDGEFLSSLHGYKKVGRFGSADRQMRSIIWPQNSGWGWSPDQADPFTLLLAINQMQEIFGVDITSSPPIVGRKMFVKHLEERGKQRWLSAQPLSLLEEYPFADAGKDAIWKRHCSRLDLIEKMLRADLADREDYDPAAPLFIHAVDKDASYSSGSQSLAVGIGEPAKFSAASGEIWNKEKHGGRPGLWHIFAQRTIDSIFDGLAAPSPLYRGGDDAIQEWVTTPLLEFMQKEKWGVEIYEGLYWPNSRRIFEDFAPLLWEKRQRFRELAGIRLEDGSQLKHYLLGYDSAKRVANSFFGMFASAKNRDKQYLRRDIWASVVEQAKVVMLYNVKKVEQETGLLPIALYTDCLIYVSQQASARHALGSLMARENKLGAYKLKWSMKVDEAVIQALHCGEPSDMMFELNYEAGRRDAALAWRPL